MTKDSAAVVDKCWICGQPANSGEHRIKRSDLKAIFGKPTQKSPIFVHNQKATNFKVGGLDSNALKLPARLCAHCNNARTQPHDLAWERLSAFVRQADPSVGSYLRADRVWSGHSRARMCAVQLYFTKLFGCLIVEGEIPIDLAPLAKAIMDNRYCPHIFLQLGRIDRSEVIVGTSDVSAVIRDPGRVCVYAGWTYELRHFAVAVSYAPDDSVQEQLLARGAWHPRLGTGRIRVLDMTPQKSVT